ncbi:MAG: hypothetical protein E7451_01300 [Ruminococcaceae bacterium]|nr:hypothetical protein [Oscillospiraceae bacterium]
MRDILEIFKSAREHYCFRNLREFYHCICALQSEFPGMTLDWDDGAGERWARLWDGDWWFMVHRRLGIAFMRGPHDAAPIPSSIAHLTIVPVTGIDAEEWYLDVDQLCRDFPEIGWHACADAVDPTAFSLSDLYYATV